MERMRSKLGCLYAWTVIAALLTQNVMIHAMSTPTEDQKNYYAQDPNPPTGHGSHGSPHHGHTPSHGHTPTPPSYGGGGGYTPTPPSYGGGGGYTPTPSPPTVGNCGTPPAHPPHDPTPPSTPSPPSGSYYNPPPHHTYDPTPSTPSTPTPPTGGYYNSPPTDPGSNTPPTPIFQSPPTTPSIPTPPYFPDPNSPGTCNYWRTHPAVIWGLLGWWGTLGSAFGVTSVPGFGASTLSLQQALSNTRTDGLGALYREGTASLLNSMVNQKFPYTTKQVRESFVAALSSNKAAAAQAQLFKLANEGRVKPRP